VSKDVDAILKAAKEATAARRAKAEEERKARDTAAELAIAEALLAVDGDERRIIVHRLEPTFGGATVHNRPAEGYWDKQTRRRQVAFIKNGGESVTAVTRGVVENGDLLQHPTLSELQSWLNVFPGLYDSIYSTIEDRCAGIDPGKG